MPEVDGGEAEANSERDKAGLQLHVPPVRGGQDDDHQQAGPKHLVQC